MERMKYGESLACAATFGNVIFLSGHHGGTVTAFRRGHSQTKDQVNIGGPRGTRTHNPRIKSQSQPVSDGDG